MGSLTVVVLKYAPPYTASEGTATTQGFTMASTSKAQEDFDRRYITSTEITRGLGISRSSLMDARKRGKMPNAICLHGQIYLWERAEVEPFVAAWKVMLDARRQAVGQ